MHPLFPLFFAFSGLALVGAFFMGVASADACTTSSPGTTPSSNCVTKGNGMGSTAIVLALGGMSLMIGGVGFQVGRNGGPGTATTHHMAMPAGPQQHYPAPGHQAGQVPPGGQGWSGRPPAGH
ncbi:hypothetical protein GCM10009780_10860 [Actinomadura alba]